MLYKTSKIDFFTIDYHDLLHRDTGGYKRSQGVTEGDKGLQKTCFRTRTSRDTFKLRGVTRGYRGLQGVTRGYMGFQKVTRGCRPLQKVTRVYRGLQKVTGAYRG